MNYRIDVDKLTEQDVKEIHKILRAWYGQQRLKEDPEFKAMYKCLNCGMVGYNDEFSSAGICYECHELSNRLET